MPNRSESHSNLSQMVTYIHPSHAFTLSLLDLACSYPFQTILFSPFNLGTRSFRTVTPFPYSRHEINRPYAILLSNLLMDETRTGCRMQKTLF